MAADNAHTNEIAKDTEGSRAIDGELEQVRTPPVDLGGTNGDEMALQDSFRDYLGFRNV
jgi:hypothetical protein